METFSTGVTVEGRVKKIVRESDNEFQIPSPHAALQTVVNNESIIVIHLANECSASTFVARGDWAQSCAFIREGDNMSVSAFDVLATAGNLTMFPNCATCLTVKRMKNIVINASNVGKLENLDLTDRERAFAHEGTDDISSFANAHRYVDIIWGQKDALTAHLNFVLSHIGRRTEVLDVGCGSGLLAFSLRANSVFPTCVDNSPAMIEILKDKNAFVADVEDSTSLQRGRQLECHLADARTFSFVRVGDEGEDQFVDFEAVLCFRTLALLHSVGDIRMALQNIQHHTAFGGVALISFPNTEVVLRRGTTQNVLHFEIENFNLCVGATCGIPKGTLDIVERVNIAGNKRITTWVGCAFHPLEETKFVDFVESYTELLLPVKVIEDALEDAGFKIVSLFGSSDGTAFDHKTSIERVYLLKRVCTAM